MTLCINRPHWCVRKMDLRDFDGRPYRGVDLLAGGLPCPPFSRAGKQLGAEDDRNLFPTGLRLVDEIRPRAVMIENVRGILDPVFGDYRQFVSNEVAKMGYTTQWRLVHTSDYGVSQRRPRVLFLALRPELDDRFIWPTPSDTKPPTVGRLLHDLMSSNGWEGADAWAMRANDIAPTIVGGSKKHGGPDLGPTRAKRAWDALGVNGRLIGKEAPQKGFQGNPMLTVRMVARIQGFPDTWKFAGAKTSAYRQVGNAFPPPVACAVARQIQHAMESSARSLVVV